jgi:hypothetical protein
MPQAICVAIVGFDGFGKGVASLIPHRPDFRLVAVADNQGYVFNAQGLEITEEGGLNQPLNSDPDAVITLLKAHAHQIDAVLMGLPNLPVELLAETVERIMEETGFKGVMVDALKRMDAIEQLFPLSAKLQQHKILYITGAGSTPGFLTGIAAMAAQSFVEVLDVNIHFGIGNYHQEAHRDSVREDFIHLEGFDAQRIACMSAEELAWELGTYGELLNLADENQPDDIILELAGICSRERVRIGGLMDTRNLQKPIHTTVTVTGRVSNGSVGSHQFVVSNEASVIDQVCGPALGFMLRGIELYQRDFFGLMTSADIMPRYSNRIFNVSQEPVGREVALTV